MMDTPYEAWAESFQFTDDLKALEALYHEQHQDALKAQAQEPEATTKAPAPSPLLGGEDDAFLNLLSDELANRLADRLYAPEVMTQYLQVTELQRDNQLMAQQIEALLARLKDVDAENQQLRRQAADYYRLFGNLYLKLHL